MKTAAEQEADDRNSLGFIGFMKYVMLGFAGIVAAGRRRS